MAPELKIRNVDEAVVDRLKARASEEGVSMEALLRGIVGDAVGGDNVSASAWLNFGFDEVDEILPGRLYEVVASSRRFRIGVTRAIVARSTKWNSTIDELEDVELNEDGHARRISVWAHSSDVAARNLGETAEMALRDAMRWLADHLGVDEISKARRGNSTSLADPAFADFAGRLSGALAGEATFSWSNDRTLHVSTPHFNFYLVRLVNSIVITTFYADTKLAAENHEQHVQLVTDAASRVAAIIREREYRYKSAT